MIIIREIREIYCPRKKPAIRYKAKIIRKNQQKGNKSITDIYPQGNND